MSFQLAMAWAGASQRIGDTTYKNLVETDKKRFARQREDMNTLYARQDRRPKVTQGVHGESALHSRVLD